MKKRSLLITGPLPDPKGGVSIHIMRLAKLISEDYNVDFVDESPIRKKEYFNFRSLNVFTYLSKLFKADIIHIHSAISVLRYLHFFLGKLFFKKIVITIHSWSINNKSDFETKLNSKLLKWSDAAIVVNTKIPEYFKLKKYFLKPAFIPPFMNEEKELPAYLIELINKKKSEGRKILVANAYMLDEYQGVDLYGLDMCIDLVEDLVSKKNENVFFVYVVAGLNRGKEKFEKYQQDILNKSLQAHFLLFHDDISFVKLVEASDIVLRPTNTDGDALTIRESLYLEKAVIASDIVDRPKGTFLFRTRDSVDLLRCTCNVLADTEKFEHQTENVSEFRDFYVELYKGL